MSNLLTHLYIITVRELLEGPVMSNGELTRGERLQIMLSPEELAALDDFRFRQRMPSRAAAVRELFRLGLASVGIKPATAGAKSGDFGVFDTGPDGHRHGVDGAWAGATPAPAAPRGKR
jgi:hypothetical protein